MMKVQKSEVPMDKSDRRRGRPAGKNRKPLSLEERRARNAQYERERRNETADAMAQLAEAACCDPQISNAELLATVISQIQRRARRKSPKDIEELLRANENLESQIAELQNRLGSDINLDLDEDSSDSTPNQRSCDSSSESEIDKSTQRGFDSQTRDFEKILPDFESTSSKGQRSRKISKTSKSSSVSGAYESETESESNSDSEWSNAPSVPKTHNLRKRRQTTSVQSDTTFQYESEISDEKQSVSKSLESDQSDIVERPLCGPEDTLFAIPEQDEYLDNAEIDNTLLEKLTEGEKQIINEWLDCNETLNARTDQENNNVRTFLDFDSFLLDINV